jgi:hypothetical protein
MQELAEINNIHDPHQTIAYRSRFKNTKLWILINFTIKKEGSRMNQSASLVRVVL